jgi:hypothetical protein
MSPSRPFCTTAALLWSFCLVFVGSLGHVGAITTWEDAIDEFDSDAAADTLDQYDPVRHLQTTSDSTRVNIWDKLRESLALAIIGALLVCLMPCITWKNEGRHVRELTRINYCKNKAVVVQASAPDAAQNGCLVHFTGTVQVDDDTAANMGDDPKLSASGLRFDDGETLNLTAPLPQAVVLKRTVYIYQKFQDAQRSVQRDRIGGGETRTTTYTLREDWTALGPQPAQLDQFPGETNSRGAWDDLVKATGGDPHATPNITLNGMPPPGGRPLPSPMVQKMEEMGMIDLDHPPHGQIASPAAHVGGFALSPAFIAMNPRVFSDEDALQPVPTEYLPESVPGIPGLTRGTDHALRTYNPDVGPQNGDVQVVYEYVPAGFDCTFVVQQTAADTTTTSTSLDAAETGTSNANDITNTTSTVKFGMDKCQAIDENCFGMWSTDLGEVWMVRKGTHSIDDMIGLAKQEEAQITKMIRIVAWFLLLVGWVMLFSPFSTALQVLPILSQLSNFAVVLTALIVSTLCCGTVTLLAYFRYRPLLTSALLALALGIWGIVIWKLNEAAEEGGSEDE